MKRKLLGRPKRLDGYCLVDSRKSVPIPASHDNVNRTFFVESVERPNDIVPEVSRLGGVRIQSDLSDLNRRLFKQCKQPS